MAHQCLSNRLRSLCKQKREGEGKEEEEKVYQMSCSNESLCNGKLRGIKVDTEKEEDDDDDQKTARLKEINHLLFFFYFC